MIVAPSAHSIPASLRSVIGLEENIKRQCQSFTVKLYVQLKFCLGSIDFGSGYSYKLTLTMEL